MSSITHAPIWNLPVDDLCDGLYREKDDPRRALRLYDRFEGQNVRLHWEVLPAFVIFPVAATALAYALTGRIAWYQTEITLLILIGLGLIPAVFAATLRLRAVKRRSREREQQRQREFPDGDRRAREDDDADSLETWMQVGWMLSKVAVYSFLFDLIKAGLVVVVGGILFGLVLYPPAAAAHWLWGTPMVLPPAITWPVAAITFGLALILVITDFRRFLLVELLLEPLLPRSERRRVGQAIRELGEELIVSARLGARDLLDFFGSLALGAFLVGSGPLGILYERLEESLFMGGLAGLMLGLSLARWKQNEFFYDLGCLGRARCLLRRGRRAEAAHRLGDIDYRTAPEYLRLLAVPVALMLDNRRKELERYAETTLHDLDHIPDGLDRVPFREIWVWSAWDTWVLLGKDVPPDEPLRRYFTWPDTDWAALGAAAARRWTGTTH